jgi:hypothetical protein
MDELEEWRARPTRQNRTALGDALAKQGPSFPNALAEIALEWAIGLPVVGNGALWDMNPENLTLAWVVAGAGMTRRGLEWLAVDAFETARRIGRGRALDRTIRLLLTESTNETDPCFWAAIALCLRFPRYAKFHGFPVRMQRSLRGIVESERDAGEVLAETEGEAPAADELVKNPYRDLNAIWANTDEDFVPCEDCQKATDAKLCDRCVRERSKIQNRNAEGRASLAEELQVENVWRRFPEQLAVLSKAPEEAEKLLREKLREFNGEVMWEESEPPYRALRPPQSLGGF